jgi:ribonuclease T1
MRAGSLVAGSYGAGTLGIAALSLWAVILGTAGCGSTAAASARTVSTVTGGPDSGAACSATADPPGGMAVLTPDQLPPEAVTTLRLIAHGGPYPYAQDNTVFGNYGGTLPRERYGYYREFTVRTPGASSRGTLRVVTGSGGEDYYTPDHYATFDWIACANR